MDSWGLFDDLGGEWEKEEKLETLLEAGVAGEGGTCSLMLVESGPREITSTFVQSRVATRSRLFVRVSVCHLAPSLVPLISFRGNEQLASAQYQRTYL
jgi:hypothetical protein